MNTKELQRNTIKWEKQLRTYCKERKEIQTNMKKYEEILKNYK